MQNEFIEKVEQKHIGKKYFILTMGCQLNENDSEKLAGMMEEMGYSLAEKIEKSDLVVINTCCVRENAVEKVFFNLLKSPFPISNVRKREVPVLNVPFKKPSIATTPATEL